MINWPQIAFKTPKVIVKHNSKDSLKAVINNGIQILGKIKTKQNKERKKIFILMFWTLAGHIIYFLMLTVEII